MGAAACDQVVTSDVENGQLEEAVLASQASEVRTTSDFEHPAVIRQKAGDDLGEEEVEERVATCLGEKEIKVVTVRSRPAWGLAQEVPDLRIVCRGNHGDNL
jgi:hypothetical protein